jgi:hypothetical protein
MTVEWHRVAEMNCEFQLEHFEEVMDLILHEPNIVSPSILRAEILQQNDYSEYTEYIRKIVPKQERDVAFIQHIKDYGATVVHATHCERSELPYFYPKFRSFRYCFEVDRIAIDVLPFVGLENLVEDVRLKNIWNRIIKMLHRFGTGTMNGYQKKVYHDLVVPKIEFQDLYRELKGKHKHWVDKWELDTDPQKHVFEDISIAAFLIALWRQEPETSKEYKFLDLGCGNGFLTHLLNSEGYRGYGIDMAKRDTWDQFDCDLRIECIDPSHVVFDNVEWIIGNHPDELTLWIPLIAAKAANCKFMVIPCCAYELSGRRFSKTIPTIGRYKTFCNEIEDMSSQIGFKVEREVLRIPSTKNQCLLGRHRLEINRELIAELCETPLVLRKSDRDRTHEYLTKKAARMERKTPS